MVFTSPTSDGPTIHVPAQVLLHALFKPVRILHPAIFTPANIDQLAFVDYASTPPKVVLDMLGKKHLEPRWVGSQHQALLWLHTSISARASAQSVHMNALKGLLNLSLPAGQVRMALHGLESGGNMYVTKASLVWVKVPPIDSITGQEQTFIFNTNAEEDRTVFASARAIQVPLHLNGLSSLTDEEWQVVEPLLQGKRQVRVRHSRRALLDTILYKIASGTSWKKVPRDGFAVTDLTSTFRNWVADGRLTKAINALESLRRSQAINLQGCRGAIPAPSTSCLSPMPTSSRGRT
ncbi:hypothetical protein B2J88_37250 [Rhodococcus sp. SRB_17]|nr:hypothetical protein [Rhodococcus sp. SRB_17]